MLIIKSQKTDYGVSFPTSITDITPDILSSITEHIQLQKHYAIIAICYKTSLFNFATQVSKSKGMDLLVTPLLAKINEDDKTCGNIGDKVIVSRTAIEMGHHIHIPIAAASVNAQQYIAEDSDLRKSLIDGTYFKDRNIDKNVNIYLIEFKIIPANDIVSTLPIAYKGIDPFKIK